VQKREREKVVESAGAEKERTQAENADPSQRVQAGRQTERKETAESVRVVRETIKSHET